MPDDEDDDCNSLIVEAFGEDRWQRASGGGGEHGQLQLFDLDDDEDEGVMRRKMMIMWSKMRMRRRMVVIWSRCSWWWGGAHGRLQLGYHDDDDEDLNHREEKYVFVVFLEMKKKDC